MILDLITRCTTNEGAPNSGYDSDSDPHELVGQSICVKWAGENWYRGVVSDYNKNSGKHVVKYEDGDERAYLITQQDIKLL
jgi:hypothetical protein